MKITIKSLLMLVMFSATFLAIPEKASAAYDGGLLIDNDIFLHSKSMSISQIQSFLSSKGSGLSTRSFLLNCYGPDSKERQWYNNAGAPCDQTVPASQIIYYAAQIYGINPQVILATLQKEQSLITSPNPTVWQITQAMGYGCPTSGSCDDASSFFYQIDSGTWVLRYHFERARGNNTWWNTSTSWTCGTEKNYYKPSLYPNQDVRFYDQDNVLYRTHRIATAATSAFYCYTPHAYNNPQGLYGLPAYGTTGRYYTGSYNFVKFFESWFGSTISANYYACRKGVNPPNGLNGRKVIANKLDGRNDNLTLVLPNYSSSGCIEVHTWTTNYQGWVGNVATNHPAVDPANNAVISADTNGDGKDELVFVKYRFTGSGKIEVHTWADDMQSWVGNVATNHPGVDQANSDVIAYDANGDKRDELAYVKYRANGSGKIEVHTWLPGQQAWYSNIATNHPAVDPANSDVVSYDTSGDGIDELAYIKYRFTGSGKIEVHTWLPGQQAWYSNIATNHPIL